MSSLDELERLARLHEQGEITDEEYEAFKKKILEEEEKEPPTVQDIPVKPLPNFKGRLRDRYERIKRRIYGETVTPLPHHPVDTVAVPPKGGISWRKIITAVVVLGLLGTAAYYGYQAMPREQAAVAVAPVTLPDSTYEEYDDPFGLSREQMAIIDTVRFSAIGDTVGYTLSYPENWLVFKPATTRRGRGKNAVTVMSKTQSLTSRDKKLSVTLASADTAKTSLERKIKQDTAAAKGRAVNYAVMRYNYYVVSGELNNKIFYKKTLLADSTYKILTILYPKDERAKYDPVAVKMGQSFK